MKTGTVIGIGCAVLAVIGLTCAGLFGGLAWLGVTKVTEAMTELHGSAESFFIKCGSGDMSGAYQSSSQVLHSQVTAEEFAATAKALKLDEYQSASWHGFNITNDQGSLDGSITTKSGINVPVKVTLVKEGGTWKVSGVTNVGGVGLGGAKPANAPLTIPNTENLKKLVRDSLLDFNKGVADADFTAFHGTLSQTWKKQTTPAELKTAFKDFVEKKINIAGIANVDPVFDPAPAIGSDNQLVVAGTYPTKPVKVKFKLTYVRERSEWKLFAISVNLVD